MHNNEIEKYYSKTQFEYKLIWNWRLKTTPALHFGYYDEHATKHADAIFRVNEILAEWAAIDEGSNILDAGCGLGNSSIWLAQHKKANVTGITLVQKQVDAANKLLSKQKISNVKFCVADFLHTPFDDASFDFVWAIESSCHAVDKFLFYKEAFRILKPGGRLVIADYARTARPLESEKEKLLKEIFNAWAVPDLDTLEEHSFNMNKAGFIDFQSKDVTKNVWVSYKNLHKTINGLRWLAKILYSTRVISKIRYNNFLMSGKQADALEQNIFIYIHILAVKPK